jgi:hypothetical protein
VNYVDENKIANKKIRRRVGDEEEEKAQTLAGCGWGLEMGTAAAGKAGRQGTLSP